MTIDELATAAAEELTFRFIGSGSKLLVTEIIARHFAPLAEERDRLLVLVKSFRKMHQTEELVGSPFTHCRCDLCEYVRAACEVDGKGQP